VADIEVVSEAANILRKNRIKTIAIGAQIESNITAAEVLNELTPPWLLEYSNEWPVGYRYEPGGEAESSGKASQSIADKLPVVLLLCCMP